MHGSAAIAGTAALLGRTQLGRPPLGRPLLRRRSPLLVPGGFTLNQYTGEVHSSDSVALILPKAPSAGGSLLVATLVSPSTTTGFTPPAGADGTGWQLGKAVICAGGRVEQWYWANAPQGLYGPNSAGAVFTLTGQSCFGGIAEFFSPSGTTQILDTIGSDFGSGSATSMPVTSAGGVFVGTLGVFSQAEFFGGSVPGGNSWTLPAGYSGIANLHNGLSTVWSHSWDGNLGAGYQNPSGGFPYTTGSNGWAAALCCYRAVTVAPIGVVGGEVTNCLDLDPTGQQLIVGGDVEGCWRTANYGDTWQPADYGSLSNGQPVMATADQTSFADIKWSLLQAGYIYACTGKTGTGQGGFLASADGGCTWTLLNGSLEYYGNGTPQPPRPASENQDDTDRTVNQLIAQDPTSNLLYTVTANMGVCRSGDSGSTWTPIGPSSFWGPGKFPRCIVINPANPAELWVGMWDTGNGKGGIYHTSNANASSATSVSFDHLVTSGTVARMKLLSSSGKTFLYAALPAPAANAGISRIQVAPTVGSLVKLNNANGGTVDTASSLWVTLDGYVDGSGDHVIVAGCSGGVPGPDNYTNVISLTLPGGNTPANYADLTGSASINTATLPPFGADWWHAGANWEFWLGGSNSVNPNILIDPNTTNNPAYPHGPAIYLCNSGGFFRSTPQADGTRGWQLAVTGMPMLGMHCFAIDPSNGAHFVHCGDDYASIDVNGDPTGNTPADIVATDPGKSLGGHHRESHAVCFDPDPSDPRLYVGLNTAYSQPTGGAVMYRPPGNPNATWQTTGYDNATTGVPNAPAVIGLFAGLNVSSNHYVVAVAQGQGTYYWTGGNWAICNGSSLPGSAGQVGQHVPIVAGLGASYLYCFDRMQGIYRSTDYGNSWTNIWPVTTSDARTGWLAINPSVNGELWFSTTGGLFKMTGAGSGSPSVSPMGGGKFAGGAAGIAFSPSGALYVIALPGTPAPAPGVTTLFVAADGGANGQNASDWADATNGDASVGSYGPPTGQLGISSSGWLWATGGEHFGFWGKVS